MFSLFKTTILSIILLTIIWRSSCHWETRNHQMWIPSFNCSQIYKTSNCFTHYFALFSKRDGKCISPSQMWPLVVPFIQDPAYTSCCCCCCCQVTSVLSDSVRPHRWQPTRLSHPWDSPGKNTGVFAIAFSNAWKWKVKVKSLSRVWLLVTPWSRFEYS